MITTKKSNYFESKIRLEKMMEDGMMAKINEPYVVDACSFTECEAKATEYISQYASGEFEVLTEVRAKFSEIFLSDNAEEDLYYKVKVAFITIDEHSGKEKKSRVDYLVKGNSVESAKKNVDEVMSSSMSEYKILSVAETNIVDIIE